MSLAARVVVVALDCLVTHGERGQRLGECFEARLGHRAPILVSVVLSDGECFPVPIEGPGSLVEPSEIAIRQPSIEPLGFFSCALDEVLTDRRAERATPAVQHQPHALGLVEAELNEVVPAPERSEAQAPGLVELLAPFRDLRSSLQHLVDALLERSYSGFGAAFELRVSREPDRYSRLDCLAHRAQVVGQLAGLEVESHCVHAAPDVDAD